MSEPRTVRVVCPDCAGNYIQVVITSLQTGATTNKLCPNCLNGYIPATLLPLASGPVVAEKEAWEAALAAMLGETREELADEVVFEDEDSGHTVTVGEKEANDIFDYHDKLLVAAFAALFPAGIVMADAVGVVRGSHGATSLQLGTPTDHGAPYWDGPHGASIEACRVAVLKEQLHD